MLYLHCGWPRTGTTSLQAVLSEQTERLAAVGVVYPDRWRVGAEPTRHGLAEMLKDSEESAGALDDFRRFLAEQAGRDVLLSAETLTNWLFSEPRQEALLGLLAAARETMPVRCAWVLRRLDEVLESLHLEHLRRGFRPPPAAERLGDRRWSGAMFAGMSKVEAAAADAVYIEYDRGGAHNRRLLEAFEIPGPAAEAICAELRRGPRRNAALTHKQATALLRTEALSARAGAELDRDALRRAFDDGFEFEHDRRCRLIDGVAKRALHEQALAGARSQGFAPYVEFFEDAEIADAPALPLDPDEIGDGDLARLLDQPAVAGRPSSRRRA